MIYRNDAPPPDFKHQAEDFDRFKDYPGYARFWEQGTGKSKPTVREQAYWSETGIVDAHLVFAPNGVHSNWVHNEWATHMPEGMREHVALFEFQSDKADTRWHEKAVADVVYGKRIPMVAMSYDALMTERGLKLAQHLLKRRKCSLTCDEAHRVKDPAAKRTKRVLAAAKWAVRRRVLTGTPVLESPFNAYTLMKIVDENYWLPYRLSTYTTFRAMFGIFGKGFASPETKRKMAARGEMDLSNQVGFQNMDLLTDALSSHSTRLLKEDVLDLPPKLYTQYEHALSKVQSATYDQLKEELLAELDTGTITASMALTQLLRLQQITCGAVPLDDGTMRRFDPNPRQKLAEQVITDIPHRFIIFNKFREDVADGMALCKRLGLRPGQYDGDTSTSGRNEVVERFQDLPVSDPRAYDVIVANTAALSEGRTLTAAKTTLYYSNGWSAIQRQQSEDRTHRLGQDGAPLPTAEGGHGVHYIDLMCPGTIDQKIVMAYRRKQGMSEKVLGDNPRDWI
jgi:SNF2 family DNA or RNA helicase